MQVTNGTITYRRSIRPADFETKDATVVLSFTVEDGEKVETVMEAVAKLAQERALVMVGLKPSAGAVRPAAAPAAGEPASRTVPGGKEAAAASLNAKDQAVKKPPGVKTKEVEPQIAVNPEDRRDPEQVDDPALDLEDGPEITDAALIDEIKAVNKKINKPPEIKALIWKYVGKTPSQSAQIPKEKRAAFLEELKKLT